MGENAKSRLLETNANEEAWRNSYNSSYTHNNNAIKLIHKIIMQNNETCANGPRGELHEPNEGQNSRVPGANGQEERRLPLRLENEL